MRLAALTLAPALLVAAATPAAAQVVRAQDPASVAAAMQAEGYRAKMTKDPTGDPMIESAVDGTKFIVLFYNCTDNRDCQTVQFYAGFKNPGQANAETMNAWNREHRFSRAYIDAENDPVVEVDLNLDVGGMSRALFADNLEVWASTVPAFRAYNAGAAPAEGAPAARTAQRREPATSL